MTKENLIRRQLLADFNQFARRMRLQSVPQSVALETFLEEVKIRARKYWIWQAKRVRESAKLSKSYRATKALFLRNLIEVNTTVLMSRRDTLNEGQVLLYDLNRPLDKPIVVTTTKKAKQLIKTLLSEGHIDKTTAKWLWFTHLLNPQADTCRKTYYIRVFRTYRLQSGSQHLLTTLTNSTTTSVVSTMIRQTSSRGLNCLRLWNQSDFS